MMNITLTAAQYSNYDLNQKPSCLQVTAASLASSVPPGITGIYGTGGEFQDVFFSNQNRQFSPCQFWKEDAFLILAFFQAIQGVFFLIKHNLTRLIDGKALDLRLHRGGLLLEEERKTRSSATKLTITR